MSREQYKVFAELLNEVLAAQSADQREIVVFSILHLLKGFIDE